MCRIPGCNAKVQDIKPHLQIHVRDSELNPDDMEAYTEVM